MKENLPFVSVIVPVWNRKSLMSELLHSFEGLEYPRDRFEVVAVDNFSSDGTWEMLENETARVPYVLRAVRNPSEVRSACSSRNHGIRVSRGEILAFTDSDCLVSPQWLSEGVGAFQEGVGIVQGRTIPHSGEAKPVLHHTVSVCAEKSWGETCNIFYRRDLVERAGGFDEHIGKVGSGAVWGEDTDLAYRIKAMGVSLAAAPAALVIHHIVPTRFSSWLFEPFRVWPWPKVVKRHPLIRSELLFGRVFYTPMTALFDLLIAGVLLGIAIHWIFLLLALPFLLRKYREGGGHLRGPWRLARVAGGSVRAFFLFCTLIGGSVRFRSLVL